MARDSMSVVLLWFEGKSNGFMRPGGGFRRSLSMSINMPRRMFRVQRAGLLDVSDARERHRKIADMTASLVEMFGTNAASVAKGQSPLKDVGGNSGIRWCELSAALDALGQTFK